MTNAPLGQWRYFVNARRAQVVHQFDSAAHGKRRMTHSADNSTDIPGRLLIDEGERSRDAIAQAAHDGAGKVYDYYFNTFKRDGLDDQGSPWCPPFTTAAIRKTPRMPRRSVRPSR